MSNLDEAFAYTIPDAAKKAGISVSSLRRHIEAHNITVRYPTKTPVILAEELKAWLRALPTEAP